MEKKEIIEKLLDGFSVPENRSAEESWSAITSKIEINNSDEKNTFYLKKWVPLMAAASIAAAVFFFFPSQNISEYSNYDQVPQEYVLPDGSQIVLHPQSELSFADNGSLREVNLKGEAFFDVEKGKRFVITTSEGSVEVLGTSFNVDARSNELDVKCYTGKVKVSSDEVSAILTKGQAVSTLSSVGTYIHDEIRKIGINGQMNFDHQSLDNIISDLKIFKNITIINSTGTNPSLTMDIADENGEEIVSLLAKVLGKSYKMVGETSFELY